MDMKNIDTDALKMSLEIGMFILILWILSHIIPIAIPLVSAEDGGGINVTKA